MRAAEPLRLALTCCLTLQQVVWARQRAVAIAQPSHREPPSTRSHLCLAHSHPAVAVRARYLGLAGLVVWLPASAPVLILVSLGCHSANRSSSGKIESHPSSSLSALMLSGRPMLVARLSHSLPQALAQPGCSQCCRLSADPSDSALTLGRCSLCLRSRYYH